MASKPLKLNWDKILTEKEVKAPALELGVVQTPPPSIPSTSVAALLQLELSHLTDHQLEDRLQRRVKLIDSGFSMELPDNGEKLHASIRLLREELDQRKLIQLNKGVYLAQGPIPARYDGFPYGGNPGIADAIIVEAFFDPLCPDSRDAWPTLKQVLLDYYPQISLIVHPFPLPYHDNSFVACRALHIANKLNVSATYPLLELFFNYQEKYYNGPTKNLSRAAIVEDIVAGLGAQAVGNSLLPAFKNGFIDPQSDSATRISFKYGCTRGVFGTPFFFINGFLLPNGGSAIDYETWKSIIDPLLRDHGERVDEAVLSL